MKLSNIKLPIVSIFYLMIKADNIKFTIWALTKERVERMRCLWVEFLVATHDDWPGPVVQWSRHRSHQTLMLFMFDSGADQAQGYTWDLQTAWNESSDLTYWHNLGGTPHCILIKTLLGSQPHPPILNKAWEIQAPLVWKSQKHPWVMSPLQL